MTVPNDRPNADELKSSALGDLIRQAVTSRPLPPGLATPSEIVARFWMQEGRSEPAVTDAQGPVESDSGTTRKASSSDRPAGHARNRLRRWIFPIVLMTALLFLGLGLYLNVRPDQPDETPHGAAPSGADATPAAVPEPMRQAPSSAPGRRPKLRPESADASEDGDYRLEVTTDYDGSLRAMGTGPAETTLFSQATVHIRKTFPGKDYRFAWLVQFGPRQPKVLQKLTRDGDRFVVDCATRTRTESGLVLFVLVLSREDSKHLSGDQPAVDIDDTVLDSLSPLYRDPIKNAARIRTYQDQLRRAWGVPPDSPLIVKHYIQVTQRAPVDADK